MYGFDSIGILCSRAEVPPQHAGKAPRNSTPRVSFRDNMLYYITSYHIISYHIIVYHLISYYMFYIISSYLMLSSRNCVKCQFNRFVLLPSFFALPYSLLSFKLHRSLLSSERREFRRWPHPARNCIKKARAAA